MPKEWRGRPVNSKQGSSDEIIDMDYWNTSYCHPEEICGLALESYNELLKMGVAPEQARMVLPLNTMTEWIWSGSLYAFHRVCSLRLEHSAQKETAEVAERIHSIADVTFPNAWGALNAA